MSPDDDATVAEPDRQPTPERTMPPAVRWLARLAVVAIALRLIVQGFEGRWSGADAMATALLVVAVVLGVWSAGYALLELARRNR